MQKVVSMLLLRPTEWASKIEPHPGLGATSRSLGNALASVDTGDFCGVIPRAAYLHVQAAIAESDFGTASSSIATARLRVGDRVALLGTKYTSLNACNFCLKQTRPSTIWIPSIGH